MTTRSNPADFGVGLRSAVAAPAVDPAAALEPDQRQDITVRGYRIEPKSMNEEDRSVEAVLATESVVTVMDLYHWRVIDEVLRMDGCKLPAINQIPLLDAHARHSIDRQIGSTRELRVEGTRLIGRRHFSAVEEGEKAWVKVKEGHITDGSIGYRVLNAIDIDPGKSAVINGKKYTAKERVLRVALEWEPKEDSLCPIGADRKAKMRDDRGAALAPADSRTGERRIEMGFKKWLEARGLVFEELSTAQRDSLRKDFDAEQVRAAQDPVPGDDGQRSEPATPPVPAPTPAPAVAAEDELRAEGARLERERVAGVRSEAVGLGLEPEVVERAITEGMDVPAARSMFLAELRKRTPSVGAPSVHVPETATEAGREVIEAAMCHRTGLEVADAQLAERADRFRDMNLLDLCRECLRMDGAQVPSRREELIARASSTVSLSNITANVANKSLLLGFMEARVTSLLWCGIGNLPDFKTSKRTRLSDFSDLAEVNAAGEIKHGEISDMAEEYSLATYARLLQITRQMIINDDLNALSKLPKAMGAAAGRLIDDLVYTHLLANTAMADGTALFASGHSNYITGSTYVMGDTGLAKGREYMRKQTDKKGAALSIEPKFLLVPPELENTTLKTVRSTILDQKGSTDGVFGNFNPHRSLEPIVEPRLSNSNFSGYSATAWYMAAAQNQADTVEVGFLNGRRTPTIERFNADPGTLGVIHRVYLDVGVKAVDHRGMFKATGA